MSKRSPIASRLDEQDFFLQFLEESDEQKDEYREIDRIALENYMVLPYGENGGRAYSGRSHLATEDTFVTVESLLAKLMLGMMGESGYVQTEPVGREDAFASSMANRLLEGVYRYRSNRRNKYTQLKDSLIFGAGFVRPVWRFQESQRLVRDIQVDDFGNVVSIPTEATTRVWDNVWLEHVDIEDFFGETGSDQVENMLGGAVRFVIPEHRAWQMVDDGRWDRSSVERAVNNTKAKRGETTTEGVRMERDDDYRENVDRPDKREMSSGYSPLVGYTGWFEVPYNVSGGSIRRELTLLNGILVDRKPHLSPIGRLIPVYESIINPVQGRLRGVAPAAVMRYTQDALNALLMCTMDGTVKKTRSPVAYDPDAEVDLARLKKWIGPIAARGGPASIGEIPYNPPLQDAFFMLQSLSRSVTGGGGAEESFLGRGLGTKRASATEAGIAAEQSGGRPSMMQLLLEEEYLPAEGLGVWELLQFFIEDDEDLQKRVGRGTVQPRTPYLEDIQGDWDIRFVGSSRHQTKQVKLQALERMMATIGAIPGAAPLLPWGEVISNWLAAADLQEVEALVADPNGAEDFIDRTVRAQQSQTNGNGNSEQPALPALGLAPAQAAGQVA